VGNSFVSLANTGNGGIMPSRRPAFFVSIPAKKIKKCLISSRKGPIIHYHPPLGRGQTTGGPQAWKRNAERFNSGGYYNRQPNINTGGFLGHINAPGETVKDALEYAAFKVRELNNEQKNPAGIINVVTFRCGYAGPNKTKAAFILRIPGQRVKPDSNAPWLSCGKCFRDGGIVLTEKSLHLASDNSFVKMFGKCHHCLADVELYFPAEVRANQRDDDEIPPLLKNTATPRALMVWFGNPVK